MGTCEDPANGITLDADLPSNEQQQQQQQQSLIQKLRDSHIQDEDDKPDEIGEEIGGDVGEEEEDGSRDISYPLRPNAENCSFYMKTGSCKFGFNCRFNHPLNRADQAVDVDVRDHDVQQGFDDSGKILCKYYSTPGGCKYGDVCRYIHSREKTDNEPFELNFLGLPMRKGERECPYYMRNGSCGYGANCRFHHPDPMASLEEPKNLMPNGGALQGGKGFATRDIAGRAPLMSLMHPPISNASCSENLPSYMPWMNALPQGMPQFPGYNQYQVAVSLPDKTLNSRPGYSVTSPRKKTDSFGFNQQLMQNEEYPERPGQPECDYFIKTGTCKFRSACRFHHPKSRTYTMPNGAPHNLKKEASHLAYNTPMGQMEEYPERPGEPECAYFMRTGECKYKYACKYHHPKSRNSKLAASTYCMNGLPSRSVPIMSHEVKKLPDLYPSHLNQMAKPLKHHDHQQPTRVEEFPERPGQPECEYFMKTGDCKYKFACRFNHPKSSRSQVSSGSECAINEKGLPLRPGAKTCRNYEQLGICKYGPRCLFDHPSSSNSSSTPEPPAPHSPTGNNSGSEDWDDGWTM